MEGSRSVLQDKISEFLMLGTEFIELSFKVCDACFRRFQITFGVVGVFGFPVGHHNGDALPAAAAFAHLAVVVHQT